MWQPSLIAFADVDAKIRASRRCLEMLAVLVLLLIRLHRCAQRRRRKCQRVALEQTLTRRRGAGRRILVIIRRAWRRHTRHRLELNFLQTRGAAVGRAVLRRRHRVLDAYVVATGLIRITGRDCLLIGTAAADSTLTWWRRHRRSLAFLCVCVSFKKNTFPDPARHSRIDAKLP